MRRVRGEGGEEGGGAWKVRAAVWVDGAVGCARNVRGGGRLGSAVVLGLVVLVLVSVVVVVVVVVGGVGRWRAGRAGCRRAGSCGLAVGGRMGWGAAPRRGPRGRGARPPAEVLRVPRLRRRFAGARCGGGAGREGGEGEG